MVACAAIAFAVLPALSAPAAPAQGAPGPASFDVDVSALPVIVAASAPSALPLDVAAGAVFSGAKLNSQPKASGEAAPGYVPLASALPLLGGPGALPQIVVRLLPGLIVGSPTIFGLPPAPIDPSLVPAPSVPVFPAPTPPPIGCTSEFPGSTEPVSCGGPTQDLLGFKIGAASGTTRSQGDSSDVSKLKAEASTTASGFGPAPGNSLLALSVGTIASAASSSIVDGRVVAGASTALNDVSIAGAVDIPAMRTSLTAALGGTPDTAAVHGEPCTISGATVAGVPVTIDGEGVHAATQNVPAGPVRDALNQAVHRTLDQIGVGLRAVTKPADLGVSDANGFPGQADLAADGTKVAASLGCLELTYTVPTSGTRMTITFGEAALRMQAFTASTFAAVRPSPSAGASPPASGGAKAAAAPRAGVAPPPAAPVAGVGAPKPSATQFQRTGRSLASWRIPYPPFGMLALAIPLLAWSRRFTLPARHPAVRAGSAG